MCGRMKLKVFSVQITTVEAVCTDTAGVGVLMYCRPRTLAAFSASLEAFDFVYFNGSQFSAFQAERQGRRIVGRMSSNWLLQAFYELKAAGYCRVQEPTDGRPFLCHTLRCCTRVLWSWPQNAFVLDTSHRYLASCRCIWSKCHIILVLQRSWQTLRGPSDNCEGISLGYTCANVE